MKNVFFCFPKDTKETVTENAAEDDQKDESAKDIENTLKRAAHVRPWDIGKDGVKAPGKFLTSCFNYLHTHVYTIVDLIFNKNIEHYTVF